MRIINTAEDDLEALDKFATDSIYNALDCCMTSEIFEELEPMVDEYAKTSYDFVRAMQGPAMAMGQRGIKIDVNKRHALIADMTKRIDDLQINLDIMAQAMWDKDLNPRSPKQMTEFFYDYLRCPVQYKYDRVKKKRVPTTDKNALEHLMCYFHAKPFVLNILRSRELSKKVGTLKTGIDSDERMRTSYNVTGTETGRWSSNENAFRTGTNLQNITNELREIFVADDGYKMAYIDLEQAESRAVAYLAGDLAYIEACESGDLHTMVASMLWPECSEDQIRGERFKGIHTRRDLAKRCGHGTNYYGKPPTIAKHTGDIDVRTIEDFQAKYFAAFPGIPQWHQRIAMELQTKGYIITPLGRKRHFFGRLRDDATLREAIAYGPQSTVGEVLNLGLYRLWKHLDLEQDIIQLLAQVHDAGLLQYPECGYDEEWALLKKCISELEVDVPVNGRIMRIPASVEGVGWNWRKYNKNNPDGLKELTEDDRQRKRTEVPEKASILHRVLY